MQSVFCTYIVILGTTNSIVVCISPLTSIMLDQADKFASRGMTVGYIGEGQQDLSVSQSVLKGKLQLVLLSPENIVNDTPYRAMLLNETYQKNLVALAVDEVHCVQTWYVNCIIILLMCDVRGSKFRTSFARLCELRSLLPSNVNIIAVTATATKETLNIVKVQLTMPNPVVIGISPHKDNICYLVQPYWTIYKLCDHVMGHIDLSFPDVPKMIIYCPTLDIGSQLNRLLKFKLRKKYATALNLVDMFNKACSIKK